MVFCNYCGSENTNGAKFCSECGKPVTFVNEQPLANQTNNKVHKLTIFRESQVYLINPPVNVSINNNKKLSINNGESVELELDEGNYEIVFSLHFRKKTINLKLNKDININLKWNRITGALEIENY